MKDKREVSEKCAYRFVDDGRDNTTNGGTCGLPASDMIHHPLATYARFALLPSLNLAHAFIPSSVGVETPLMRDAEIVRKLRELFDFPPDEHRSDGGMRHCRCYYAVRELLETR